MTTQTTEQVLSGFERILKQNKIERKNPWLDHAMRFATTISAAGVIALFALFTTQLPNIRADIADVSREQEYMRQTLAEVREFTTKPRFTKEDFILEMKLYDKRIELIENELRYRSEFMMAAEKRIKELEKQ